MFPHFHPRFLLVAIKCKFKMLLLYLNKKKTLKKFVSAFQLYLLFLLIRSSRNWKKNEPAYHVYLNLDGQLDNRTELGKEIKVLNSATEQFILTRDSGSLHSLKFNEIIKLNTNKNNQNQSNRFMLRSAYANKGTGVFSYFSFGLGTLIIMAIIAAMILQWLF